MKLSLIAAQIDAILAPVEAGATKANVEVARVALNALRNDKNTVPVDAALIYLSDVERDLDRPATPTYEESEPYYEASSSSY